MTEDFEDFLLRALDDRPVSIERISQGRNSRVWSCVLENGKRVVVKEYFQFPDDKRNRLKTEIDAINFMRQVGIVNIPTVLAIHEFQPMVIFEEVIGDPIAKDEITDSDIQHAVTFLQTLKECSCNDKAKLLPRASEACFETDELKTNFHFRINRLTEIKSNHAIYSQMKTFLFDMLLPLIHSSLAEFEELYGSYWELSQEHRTLSPSDFGFHNALRGHDRQVVFLDFEYFGWDDPAKTICDFLLHDAMLLSLHQKQLFVQRLLPALTTEDEFFERLRVTYRLFGLKWCLILLNEFVSSDRIRREFAGMRELGSEALLDRQLDKSMKLWQRMNEREDESIFG